MSFIELTFFRAYPFLKPHILFYGDAPAIWHGFPDINYIKVNNDRKSAIFNWVEFYQGISLPQTAHFVL